MDPLRRLTVDAGETEEELRLLDFRLSQLRREFEQYFLGTRPREPVLLRSEVAKQVIRLSNTPIKNTALRFKFSSLCSRFHAFKRQWDDTLRRIEDGTYERHQFKARIHSREQAEEAAAPKPTQHAAAKAPAKEDLYQSYVDARLACGQSVKGLTRKKLEAVIEKQREELRTKYGDGDSFRFRVAVEDGVVRVKAARVAGQS